MRKTQAFVVRAILAGVLAAGAWAHGTSVVHLDELDAYIAQKEAETASGDKKVHNAWKKLDAAMDRDSKGKLAKDLGKIAAISKASNSTLVADAQLRTLLDAALSAADQALSQVPESVAELIGQIRKQSDRDKVLNAVLAARTLVESGRAADTAGDEEAQLKAWKKANTKFEQAKSLARAFIKRQGGPLPQFKTPEPNRVYTVVGRGQGGFNGDGHIARNTQLYFVEECRVGPDGLLYILDWNNHMMRRRTADGRVERVCGSGIPGDSEGAPMDTDLNHPSSLVFDGVAGGKVFMAAWHNHKVKVYDPVGGAGGTPTVYTIAGTVQGGGTDAQSGDGGLATTARYNLLPGIVRLPDGDLLTADAGNEVIRRIDLSNGVDAPNLVGTMVRTGTITRFAGTRGVPGITGDDGQAIDCTLNFSRAQNAEPDGRMELSPDGNSLYVICGQGNCIRKIDMASGVITRFAGTGAAGYTGDGGPAVNATLNRPSDIAVAPDGTVFISDANNHVIRRVAADGTITTYAGNQAAPGAAEDDVPVAQAVFKHPSGLDLDADGNLYVCDRENSVIRVITSAAPGTTLQLPVAPFQIPTNSRGGPPAKGPAGTIDTYAGRAPDVQGTVDAIRNSVNLGFNGNDLPSRDTFLYWPQDVAVDPSPTTPFLHIVDWNNHRIRRVEDDGRITTVVGSGLLGDAGGEGEDAKLNHPTDITFHPATGELWMASWHTDKIQRMDSAGTLVYMAGNRRAFTDGVVANLAEMNLPTSVKFLSNGDWFVCDEGNRRIRRVVAATNVMNTFAGTGGTGFSGDNGPALNATIDLPVGQAAQPAGRIAISPDEHWLYVCDTLNNRVRRIDLTDAQNTITTFAGNGAAAFAGDGGPATSASLNFPTDVDCDAAGNVYIADADNSAIRKVDVSTNVITTIAGTGTAGFSGDGGPANQAMLQTASGIHVVRTGPTAGRIYVADTYNGIVRVIWE